MTDSTKGPDPHKRGDGVWDSGVGALLEALRLASPDGFAAVSSKDGRLLATNPRLFEVWGIPEDVRAQIESLGSSTAALPALQRAFVDQAPGYESYALRDVVVVDDVQLRDGRVLERCHRPVGEGEGLVRAAFFRDVTHQRATDRELKRHAAQQALLAELMDEALVGNNLDELLDKACTLTAQFLGIKAVMVVDVSAGEWRIRASHGEHAAPLGIVPKAGERGVMDAFGYKAAYEIPLPSPERSHRVLGAYARDGEVFGRDEVGLLESVGGVLTSALARIRAESALGEREAQLRAVFDASLDAMLVASADGRLADVNLAACDLFGRKRELLVGRQLGDLVPALGPRGPDEWEKRRAAGRATGEVEVLRERGERRLAEYTAVANIQPGLDLLVLRDVTEEKLLGARLALADRLASVGTLAAGVAHELNNPLAYISANLAYLADRVSRTGRLVAGDPVKPDDADLAAQLAEAVHDARDGCERMRVIIRDLKTFSRPEDEHTGPVDVARVMDSALNMAWNEIKHRARLQKDLSGLPPVHGNEGRLGQVFLNLIVNAAQALPEGSPDEHRIRIQGAQLPDGRISVEVTDTGCGIAPEHIQRVFDPFFTTKPPGVGSGLGLSICHSIVSGLGGEITVESKVGHGSTFRVTLRPAEPALAKPSLPAPAPVTRRARILIVDDEALVANVLARTLRRDHDVAVVTSAREALAKLAAGERYDLLISDLLMPEMTGMDLYAALEKRGSALVERMVFLTGGAFTAAARDFIEKKSVVCLEKPFDVGVLRATLAKKLAENSPAKC